LRHDPAGLNPALVDCDAKRKLQAFIGDDVRSLDIGASADELRRDPQLAVSYWDELSEIIVGTEGDSIVDFGANVDRHVWNWARKSSVSDFFEESGVSLDIYVPITAEPLAVEGGIELLRETISVFPNARKILVLNQAVGTFETYAGSGLLSDLNAMKEKNGLKVVIMPRCLSEGWLDFERLRLPFSRIVTMNAEEISDVTGLSTLKARRALGDIAEWLNEMYNNFKDLVPHEKSAAAIAGSDERKTRDR
jgi:hypothetical protein